MSARRTATRKRRPRPPARPATVTTPAPDPAALARRYFIYVVIAMVVAAAILSLLAIQRYRDYYGGRFDLGNMTQAVYNTAHGHFLRTTAVDGKQISRLGAHVDPILAVFAIPWFVWPSPMMLLVGQAIIVALAAWPAYRLGLRILGDARAAFFCAVALLDLPSAAVRGAQRVPPRDPGHHVPAVRLRLHRRRALVAGCAVRRARRVVQRGDPPGHRRHGRLLRAAQAQPARRCCSRPWPPSTS